MRADTDWFRKSGITEIAAGAVVLVAAFVLTVEAGSRGLYPFDQSIVFDGSYRVLSGQIPYRDFLLPFGPVTFWLHALFFKILGVNYQAYVSGAGVINVAASLAAMLIVKMIFPRLRFLPLAAGILTAVWFYPPFGTPWADQTAFFFALLATGVLIRGLVSDVSSLRRTVLVTGAGCFAVIAFLSKQNVGSFVVFLFPLLVVVSGWERPGRCLKDLGFLVLGGLCAGGAFLVWLVAVSDAGEFIQYFFEIPAELGRKRLAGFVGTGFGILRPFFGGRGPALMIGALWGSFGVGVAALVAARIGKARVTRKHLLGAVLCIYLVAFQHIFINTTLNQPENALGFSGLVVALAWGIMATYTSLGRGRGKVVAVAGLALLVFFASTTGWRVAMRRDVHEMLRGARFRYPLPIDGLRSLKWAEPTSIRGSVVRPEHLVYLSRYLTERDENFFIFPDFTLLYGVLGKPSPQPLLWFHQGVTYSGESNRKLDERIVSSLKENNVRIFVREQAAWFNTGERLDDFPALKAFLRSEYEKVGEIGIFSIYEIKSTQ